jgi:hypothetical protein
VTAEAMPPAVQADGLVGGGAADGVPAGVSPELPSERLARLARDAAARVAVPAGDRDGVDALAPAAAAAVYEAVQASLADASKTAYRSDWTRFTGWAADSGYPFLPAVVAAYVTGAAAQQRPNGPVRLRAGDADPVGVLDQPAPHRRRPGPAGPVGTGPPRPVRDPPDPGDPAVAAGPVAAGRHPRPGGLADPGRRRLAGGGGRPAATPACCCSVSPARRTGRADPGRRDPAPHRRPAHPAPQQQERPGGRGADRSRSRTGGIRPPARPALGPGGGSCCRPPTPPHPTGSDGR